MRVKTDFPRAICLVENVWIPLLDGCRLAARIWLPEDAEERPVPAVLEYIPYRKGDATAVDDSLRHAYLAGHGYASVRVDIRGSGDSDGILEDEYLPQEQDDAVEAIAWLAAQPWCTGAVGMFGISWGGFNALQVAARRPPALKAVISHCSTDDRYADDVHYLGGCVLAYYMLSWASTMLAYNARPPDPAVVGERWREMWLKRLEKTPPFVEAWLSHQRRDAYWQQGSVCEDYAAIACPVYMVGGWADPYRNAVLRFLAGCPRPRKGLIGPWGHTYPEQAAPGPAIGFLQESLRWWDHWLKGEETGIMDEPLLRACMQEAVEPRTHYAERPGRWVAESAWPSPRIETRTLFLNGSSLAAEPAAGAERELRGAQAAGLAAGNWCPFGNPGDFPPDQRGDDALSLTFDSEPLPERLELLGFPEAVLTVSADRPNALLAVRLCDVAPSGSSTLVTRGALNLTHRDSHEQPTPLEPGRRSTVSVRLNAIAYALPAGHRLRLAVSPTYWPWLWPSPEPVTLTLATGEASRLELPVRPPQAEDAELAPFGPPEGAPPLEIEVLQPARPECRVSHDHIGGVAELVRYPRYGDRAVRLSASGLEYGLDARDSYRLVEGDPLSATCRSEYTIAIGRGDWRTRIETTSTMSADAERFHVTSRVDAYEGNTRVFAKARSFSVPRDLV